jgi:hypothetical protein
MEGELAADMRMMAPTYNDARRTPPKPTAPACPFCEEAVWRFNGRSWYASDPVSKRRHVCVVSAALTRPQTPSSEGNGHLKRFPETRERAQRGAGVAVGVVLATGLAALAGVYATRAMRQ